MLAACRSLRPAFRTRAGLCAYRRLHTNPARRRHRGHSGHRTVRQRPCDRTMPVTGDPVRRLRPASASAAMLHARFGLVDYRLDLAAKSGIFAAYAAHGLVPLVRSTTSKAADGLGHAINLVHTCEGPMAGEAMQRLATAAHLWYQHHAVSRSAFSFCTSPSSLVSRLA